MKSLLDVALELQLFIQNNNWKFCIIGGLALQRWGNPRVTNDVDLTLLTNFTNEEIFIDAFLQKYAARIPDAKNFALTSRVLLLKSSNRIGIDIALGGMPLEIDAVSRASFFSFTDKHNLLTASAEDLIVMKAFANRAKDWDDIKGMLIRNKANLDLDYIMHHLIPLCDLKEEPDIVHKLQALIKTCS